MIDTRLKKIIKFMPKVELHLHLEGSIRAQTAMDFIQRNNKTCSTNSINDIKKLYRFNSLSEFVQAMRAVSDNIIYLEDLKRVTSELLKTLAEQNVRYVEFDCAIQKYLNLGYSLEDIIETIYSCVRTEQRHLNLQARLIVNIQRAHGSKKAVDLVRQIAELEHPFIAGIGLSGDETKYPQYLFADAFELAKFYDLKRTAHAGEAMGPESIWGAIRHLYINRIDHGTRAVEDPCLLNYLMDSQIPLTQCLSSNIRLHVVNNMQDHPFGLFYKNGLFVTLNTDDPEVFGTTLTREYELAAENFQLSADDLSKIVINGITASFLDDDSKRDLTEKVQAEFYQIYNEIGMQVSESYSLR